jgi:hypothetical protein
MKRKSPHSKPVKPLDTGKLLAEAMKQPGVYAAMEAMELAEKYTRPVSAFGEIIEWQRFPAFFTSCNHTSCLL